MNEKPSSILSQEDISLTMREDVEEREVLASGEKIHLYCERRGQLGYAKKNQGSFLTNLRFFHYNNGKVKKYVFLNDIRRVESDIKPLRSKIIFQLVDGSRREFGPYKKEVVKYLLELFEAYLLFDIQKIQYLLQGNRETLERKIKAIVAANVAMDEQWLLMAQKLWQCQRRAGEGLLEMMIRELGSQRGLARIFNVKKLWENPINVNRYRKKLVAISKEKNLKIPKDI